MEDISVVFKRLQISLAGEESSSTDDTLPPVKSLIEEIITALDSTEESELDTNLSTLLPHIRNYLEKHSSNVETASLLKFLAEVSKYENCRQLCTDAGLMPCLLKCLEQNDPAVALQTLRAIGNISCDNNKARESVLKLGGVEKIILKLKELHDLDKTDESEKLRRTACGSILNLSLDNELLQKEVINFGAIPVLLGYIKENSDKTDLCFMAANTVSCLVDLEEGHTSFINANGCKIFVDTLRNSSDKLTSTLCECLVALIDEDDVKMAFVKESCIEVLQEIISKNILCNNENKEHVRKLKTAVDIIVLVLADDACLEVLFSDENNAFMDKIFLWNNSNNAYIRNSGPVAIGNIARTEVNCVRLVKMEVHKHLISLLQETTESNEKDEIQLYVSVLSALKNLAIPENNKAVLIESGVLDYTLKFMASSETPSPLAFRAITVSRLLVQGQATAVDKICSQESCVSNIVSVAENSGIEAVQSEAARLLATLLKNARTSVSILSVVRNNGLQSVVSMINSPHVIMQNEALVAIVLTINTLDNSLSDKLDESNLLSNITRIFDAEKPEPQTCYNSMAVMEALFVKGLVPKSKLEDSGILNKLEKLANHEHQTVSQRAASVIQKIKNS